MGQEINNLQGLQPCFDFSRLWQFVLILVHCATIDQLSIISATAAPAGYQAYTVPLDASAAGLAFGPNGVLYALETAPFGSNQTQIRVIQKDSTICNSFSLVGDDPENFYVGGFTYDPYGQQLLITDNTTDGRIYSVSDSGVQQLLATEIPTIADIVVRSTGEIFVSTALGNNSGEVLLVDRGNGSTTTIVSGIDFGAGLAFDLAGNLIVQEADASTFAGRLQLLPIADGASGLEFGELSLLLDNMQSSFRLALDDEGDIFTTGRGGLFSVSGDPFIETSFVANDNPALFATAIAFDPGALPFEPFSGADAGRLAFTAKTSDPFITLIRPLPPFDADFNDDEVIDSADLSIWETNFGLLANATNALGDADGDFNVDGADFLTWQRELSAGPFASESFFVAIPEPTTLSLLVLLLFLTTMFSTP